MTWVLTCLRRTKGNACMRVPALVRRMELAAGRERCMVMLPMVALVMPRARALELLDTSDTVVLDEALSGLVDEAEREWQARSRQQFADVIKRVEAGVMTK